MIINPYWQQSCEHRWDRHSYELNMCDQRGLSATVGIANETMARLPGFKNKWVWTCWIRQECPAWIGPFDTAKAAMDACEAHFKSDHTKIFWPDEVTDVDDQKTRPKR